MKAYCLIKVRDGEIDDVTRKIREAGLQGVEAVHKVAGTYDIVVEVVGDDPRTIGLAIVENIQKINGIVSTVTLLAIG